MGQRAPRGEGPGGPMSSAACPGGKHPALLHQGLNSFSMVQIPLFRRDKSPAKSCEKSKKSLEANKGRLGFISSAEGGGESWR